MVTYQEVLEALPLEETKEKFEVQTISLQGLFASVGFNPAGIINV
jgi:hypothetical protein